MTYQNARAFLEVVPRLDQVMTPMAKDLMHMLREDIVITPRGEARSIGSASEGVRGGAKGAEGTALEMYEQSFGKLGKKD